MAAAADVSDAYRVGGSRFDPSQIKAAAIGAFHYCFLLEDESVVCGGENNVGQLGLGSIEQDTEFEPGVHAVRDLRNVEQIAAGGFHTCAVVDNGDPYCWGSGHSRLFGSDPEELPPSGSHHNSSKPIRVPNLEPVLDVVLRP